MDKALREVRRAAIIARREGGETYISIGKSFGITKQRVHQMLLQAGRYDLCHSSPKKLGPRIKKTCANLLCGQSFDVTPCYSHKRFCGSTCYHADRRERGREEIAPRIEKILQLRNSGMTWKAVGEAMGLKTQQPGTQVLITLSRWRALPPTTVTRGS